MLVFKYLQSHTMLETMLTKGQNFISNRRNKILVASTALLAMFNLNAQNTAEYTSLSGAKSNINSLVSEIANPSNTTNHSGVVNDGPSILNISLGVEDYFNTNKNFHIVNNPGNPTIFFNGTNPNKASVEVYNLGGQNVGTFTPQRTSDGTTLKAYVPLTDMRLSTGMYLAVIKDEFGRQHNAKLINSGSAPNHSVANLSSRVQEELHPESQVAQAKNNLAAKSNTTNKLTNTHRFKWDAQFGKTTDTNEDVWTLAGSKDVEIIPGQNNAILIDNVVNYTANETGGINIVANLNNVAQNNVKVVIENLLENFQDSIPSIGALGYAQFKFAPIINGNSETYKFILTDLDGKALPTEVTRNPVRGGDFANIYEVDLIPIPNEQDITFAIRDYETLNPVSGVQLEVLKASDSTVVSVAAMSDANGKVTIPNIPGEGTYLSRTSKNGHMTKIVGPFVTPLVDHVSEMTEEYNTTTIPNQTYSNGNPITAEQANMYKLLATDTETIHLRKKLHVEEDNQFVKNEIDETDTELGFPGATTYKSTLFSEPTQNQINNYNEYGPQPFPEELGDNVELAGTDTNPIARTNGIFPRYSFNTSAFKVGSTIAEINHEDAQRRGFAPFNAGGIIPLSCLDTSTPSELSIYDLPNMRLKLKTATNHFKNLINGKPAEYNFKTFYFE